MKIACPIVVLAVGYGIGGIHSNIALSIVAPLASVIICLITSV